MRGSTTTHASAFGAGWRVGALGVDHVARVDADGCVTTDRATWTLEWWVGADDRWHVPAAEAAVRQSLVADMPVVRTAMRVPSGDAVQHVFGAPDHGGVVVHDVENASPAPFVLALVVRGAHQVALDGAGIVVDGHRAVVTTRSPSRSAVATDGSLFDMVVASGASTGPFPPRRDRAARLHAAFLYPVPHRTTLRAAVALGRRDLDDLDLRALPTAEAVATGWRAQLGRGARVVLPDEALQARVDQARAGVLLAGQEWNPPGTAVAALEEWGFDREATAAWRRLNGRERRVARRRGAERGNRTEVPDAGLDTDPGRLLLAVSSLLVQEIAGGFELLTGMPATWRGQDLEVHELPTRHGAVSFALRWHGARPALLWDVPPGFELRVPDLDPTFSSREPQGEALLAAPA